MQKQRIKMLSAQVRTLEGSLQQEQANYEAQQARLAAQREKAEKYAKANETVRHR